MDRVLKKLNEKAKKVLVLMAEHNYISINEVKLFASERMAARYLKLLKNWAFVQSIEFPYSYKRNVIHCLTPLGYKVLENHKILRAKKRFTPSSLRPSYVAHTLTVIQTRLVFEKHPAVVDFQPEKVTRHNYWETHHETFKGKSCDAEVFIQRAKKYRVGLEVQISRKAIDTYQSYIRKLDRRSDLDRIIWVCADKNIMKGLQLAVRKENSLQGHFFTTTEELKQKGLEGANWQDRKGETIPLFQAQVQNESLRSGFQVRYRAV